MSEIVLIPILQGKTNEYYERAMIIQEMFPDINFRIDTEDSAGKRMSRCRRKGELFLVIREKHATYVLPEEVREHE